MPLTGGSVDAILLFGRGDINMRQFRAAATALIGVPLAGCAMHPLPEDYSRYKTTDIVRQVRCEAKAALRSQLIKFLSLDDQTKRAKDVGLKYSDNTNEIDPADYAKLDKAAKEGVDEYRKAAIAYDFELEAIENNKYGAGLDLLNPLAGGTINAAIRVGSDFQRKNTRNFTMTDSFQDLLFNADLQCGKPDLRFRPAYPVTGTIGLGEVFDTFVSLNEFGKLQPGDKQKAPYLSDTLFFQTKIYGSVSPTLELLPAGQRWQTIGSPTNTIGADRTDNHKVTITLTVDSTPPEAPAGRGRTARSGKAVQTSPIQPLSVPPGSTRFRTNAEINAAEEAKNQSFRQILKDNNRLYLPR
ncbi:hypothetical protein [Bosea sp. PAMC 26642]|uniref:hypothetical protein n=1 Tax=Bosea sp. (strain PAMC 26642) TaxID=1792307 RepID=UPI00077006B3|nr:hypothetical protein [Bosea sp. PAMC 26642]AMJ62139.1 hypothetical protein AXW83_19200 [Bosea sp. PAMC 26642]